MRYEHDFLGEMSLPDNVYYGVQTLRAMENFKITRQKLDPVFIQALAMVKKAAAKANIATGRLDKTVGRTIVAAADEVIDGKLHDQFCVDPIQGGAGTSFNMNMNEVLANRALELIGDVKGNYERISPNNHVNMAQSTNDAFPTAVKVCAIRKGGLLITALSNLSAALDKKSREFNSILKMGRTHLQDAVPITLGQEFAAYAASVRRGAGRIDHALLSLRKVNMGATAVGTGLNAEPEYIREVVKQLSQIAGAPLTTAENLVDATNSTDAFADISGAMKITALSLIKIANDFRLMASGPRCGINELLLPARQPGSSIMPGKVNPVIPEVLNQTCYQVIGNDLAVTLGVENGQFELNVMEPVMAFNIFNSMTYLTNAVDTFNKLCVQNVQANTAQCQDWLEGSVGIVTALLPHIGYENASLIAKEAYNTGKPVRQIILSQGLLTKEDLDVILSPEEMTQPGIAGKSLLQEKGPLAQLA
ncbi:aspartate ammonia-lyase|uniref:aspartate ammonia-lyase n=1 Tax=Dendrosporobacter quercicolus TaxID=146817 RepID=A0A1G9Q6A1_9FIRM|nr:aspartate ammonia-lyase [Dendrosporobacter quercicolus]NSL48115.1 aspartate ammonia-lyase [Dendrosporobacter quercicolus DSM 1736]SDM05875.1 aspartate ammonia-lyase [Dendrosporobacter quercicolus]